MTGCFSLILDELPALFLCGESPDHAQRRAPALSLQVRSLILMNSKLLASASKVIPLPELLVNVVSRRVRQLNQGHRPLIATPPGMGIADVALSEIIEGKLTSQPTEEGEAVVATFPGVPRGMQKAA